MGGRTEEGPYLWAGIVKVTRTCQSQLSNPRECNDLLR